MNIIKSLLLFASTGVLILTISNGLVLASSIGDFMASYEQMELSNSQLKSLGIKHKTVDPTNHLVNNKDNTAYNLEDEKNHLIEKDHQMDDEIASLLNNQSKKEKNLTSTRIYRFQDIANNAHL